MLIVIFLVQNFIMESTDPMIKGKSTAKTSSTLMLWKVLAIVFIVISIALLIALIVVATKQRNLSLIHI